MNATRSTRSDLAKALREFSENDIVEKKRDAEIKRQQYDKAYAEREIRFQEEGKRQRASNRADERRHDIWHSALLARLQLELNEDAGIAVPSSQGTAPSDDGKAETIPSGKQ